MPKSKVRGRKSSDLVVDASVVKASGGESATHPTAKSCRDFLQCMLEVCHRAALTPEIGAEWKRHPSKFASTWRFNMEARKKIVRISNDDLRPIVDEIVAGVDGQRQQKIIEKDAHLIHGALRVNRVVVSLDDNAKQAFGVASKKVRSLKKVRWIVPTVDPDGNLAALKANDFRNVGSLLGS